MVQNLSMLQIQRAGFNCLCTVCCICVDRKQRLRWEFFAKFVLKVCERGAHCGIAHFLTFVFVRLGICGFCSPITDLPLNKFFYGWTFLAPSCNTFLGHFYHFPTRLLLLIAIEWVCLFGVSSFAERVIPLHHSTRMSYWTLA